MLKKLLVTATVVSAVFISTAMPMFSQASELSYSYVDLARAERDADGDKASGLRLEASVALADFWYIAASSESLSADNAASGDPELLLISTGFHRALRDDTDLVASVGFLNFDNGVSDGDGYQLKLGLRALPRPRLEAQAALLHRNIDEQTLNGWQLGLRFFVKKAISLGLTHESFNDDSDELAVSARLDF